MYLDHSVKDAVGDKGTYKMNWKRMQWAENLVFAGFTPLMMAANVGNVFFVKLLLRQGYLSNVNATNDDGDSALNLAAESGEYQFGKMKLYWTV